MPCIKCNNGRWKYGQHGKCVYDTEEACHRAAAAIHIQDPKKVFDDYATDDYGPCPGKCEDCSAELAAQYK